MQFGRYLPDCTPDSHTNCDTDCGPYSNANGIANGGGGLVRVRLRRWSLGDPGVLEG